MSTTGDDLRRRAMSMQEGAATLNALAAKMDAIPRPVGDYVSVLTEILFEHGLCVVAKSALTLAHRSMEHVKPAELMDDARDVESYFIREFDQATQAVEKAMKGNR